MKNRRTLILAATAAAFFAAGVAAPATVSAQGAKVKCTGVNACKGQSECKTASTSCKGLNACKGQGFIETTAADCTAKGGKVSS